MKEMKDDDILEQLRQAAVSFRHIAKFARETQSGPIDGNAADFHASQLQEIVEYLTELFDTGN